MNSDVFIDDVKLQDLGISVRLSSQEPMLPGVRSNSIVIPGRHGAYDFGAFFDVREFALDCVFKRQDYSALKTQIREFVQMFIDEYGRPKSVRLRFGDEPDKYYDVKVSGGIPVERLAGHGLFTLPLVAHDPHAYAEMNAYNTPSYYDQAEEGMYYENTESFQWEYARHYSGVHNYSSINTPLIIEIEGTMLNPSITHIESGKKLILPSIFSSRKVEINAENYTITSNGFNILFETNSEFLTLVPGDNGFLFEANSPNAKVTYKWKHKYI